MAFSGFGRFGVSGLDFRSSVGYWYRSGFKDAQFVTVSPCNSELSFEPAMFGIRAGFFGAKAMNDVSVLIINEKRDRSYSALPYWSDIRLIYRQ